MRMIDADALRKDVLELSNCPNGYSDTYDKSMILALIDEAPTVDTVKVIRCGDCKYKDNGIDEDGFPFLKCLNGRSYGGTRINDYCSWAERKENGTD